MRFAPLAYCAGFGAPHARRFCCKAQKAAFHRQAEKAAA